MIPTRSAKVTVRQELLNLQPPATVVDAPAASDQPAKSFLANLLVEICEIKLWLL